LSWKNKFGGISLAKTYSMSIKEFMGGQYPTEENKLVTHFKKHGQTYIKVAGLTAIVLTAPHYFAFASSGIDVGAEKLYKQLIGVGKWIIIFQGGFKVIQACGQEDFDKAKKSLIGYVLTYLFLLGLPFIMDEIDTVFSTITTSK
jgi:hypothetical protein